jgi:hypothetical protein
MSSRAALYLRNSATNFDGCTPFAGRNAIALPPAWPGRLILAQSCRKQTGYDAELAPSCYGAAQYKSLTSIGIKRNKMLHCKRDIDVPGLQGETP